MAEEVITTPPHERPPDYRAMEIELERQRESERELERERRREGAGELLPTRPRISWGAIFGGAFSALGLWLLLYAFGVALGFSTVDPNNPGSVKGSGIFTGVWSGVAPLIALFVGGLVAGRLSGVFSRGYGALHGLVMWGLVSVAGVYFVGSIVATAVTGAASAGKAVVQGGGEVVKGVTGGAGGAASALGLDWNDALGPINQRLQAEGKPTVTADQLQAATKDAVQGSVRQGRFDRATFESALARNTALSRQDAQELSQRAEQQFNQTTSGLKQRAQGAMQSMETGALKAVDVTGKAFWAVFGALALGLAASIVGGLVGAPTLRVKRAVHAPRVTPVEPPPRGPIITSPPREAYPR
jgi:hypothetical protein